MANLVEKDLSYKVVGILFGVYNGLGGGYQEKYYQRAIARELRRQGIEFKEQLVMPLEFGGQPIGRYFLDFLIEDRMVLEVKATSRFYFRDVKQVLAYLKRANIELGVLANFSRNNLQLKRVLRGHSR
ncbi:MAG: hypothetical protein A3A43_02130 [Candidatus Liptonbacteria bacterium RIFCSPLOWO2_01_FULL_56_20]|uniref:GxxExxY protein n=1 Tax=Candidatus Liptonbacteria bacterium RIFCSPLOWO2_01_FULL_56_20 TaxID=1798652 RepID=A0A1G2CKD0_9BACT|nr:MAG: hypothetical protein A2681_02380 [Candidatus Liptonbacteria bacterium RIFCSPHIGHO2_01_FULL_56_18b]OGZ01809.1 MAG: hypothetical protein A3A43_02130 [Candidatus Liptonbacteria bacterium RIFCSPLOWO2_01_FULL_56_20]